LRNIELKNNMPKYFALISIELMQFYLFTFDIISAILSGKWNA